MYKITLKRFFDFVLSLFIVLAFFPLILVLWLSVYLKLGKPVLFIQERPGKDEKIFKLFKFRSMTNECNSDSGFLPDNARITRFGRFLRKTSLDEIPQFFNVLKGDISLVGPRPLLVDYLPLYNEEQKRRHLVKPGITGWAQVNGRNAISWQEKFRLDVWYIDNLSFLLDLKILLLTIIKVFKSKDVNSSDIITMDKFAGNN